MEPYWILFVCLFAGASLYFLIQAFWSFEKSDKSPAEKSRKLDDHYSENMSAGAADHQAGNSAARTNLQNNLTLERMASTQSEAAAHECEFQPERSKLEQDATKDAFKTQKTMQECTRAAYEHAASLGFTPLVWDAVCLQMYGVNMGDAIADIFRTERLSAIEVKKLIDTTAAQFTAIKDVDTYNLEREAKKRRAEEARFKKAKTVSGTEKKTEVKEDEDE